MTNAANTLAATLAAVATRDIAAAAAYEARGDVGVTLQARRAATAACDHADEYGDVVAVAAAYAALADARAAVVAAEAAAVAAEAAWSAHGAAAVAASVAFFFDVVVPAAVAAGTRPVTRSYDLVTGEHCHGPTHAVVDGVWYTLAGGSARGLLRKEENPDALAALGSADPHGLGTSWGSYQGGRFCGTVYRRL